MKKIGFLILAALLLFVGCARSGGAAPTSLTKNLSLSEKGKAPVASCSNFGPAAEFAGAFFSRATEEENPVISPASAYLCLAMVMNGADKDTLREFESVMGGGMEQTNLLSRTLIRELTETSGSTVLNIANSAWVDDDHAKLKESYLQAIVDYFGADVFTADMPSDEALKAVNSWVNEKTNGLIPTLHDENYPESTILVLLNTLYLKAKWQDEFLGYQTSDATFTKSDGTALTVPFMHALESHRSYIRTDDAEGVLLPYDDGKTAFVALRPTDGSTPREFAATLTADKLTSCIGSATDTLVNLSMPKFTIEYKLYLNDILIDMGLTQVFDTSLADLSKMGEGVNGPLYLSWVFQKVKIEVNEEGTEAAAVTEAAMLESAFLPEKPPVELNLDSPFVYAVVDLATGLPMFMGILDDPS